MSKRFFQSRGLPLTLVSLCLSLAMSSAAHSQCINTTMGLPDAPLTSIVVGCSALNKLGANNTAIGNQALNSNDGGYGNTATGMSALYSNKTGAENTAIGVAALAGNTTGGSNTAVGVNALSANTIAGSNTAVGHSALKNQQVPPWSPRIPVPSTQPLKTPQSAH